METNLAEKRDDLPYGRSSTGDWPGGVGQVMIEGSFQTADGVSTQVSLYHQPRQADGSYGDVVHVKDFSSPGVHKACMGPGRFFFWASGPDDAPWSLSATIAKPPRKDKPPTLSERVKALETGKRRRAKR